MLMVLYSVPSGAIACEALVDFEETEHMKVNDHTGSARFHLLPIRRPEKAPNTFVI